MRRAYCAAQTAARHISRYYLFTSLLENQTIRSLLVDLLACAPGRAFQLSHLSAQAHALVCGSVKQWSVAKHFDYVEKRLDPYDGEIYTLAELRAKYAADFTRWQVEGYWEYECKRQNEIE